MGRFLGDVPGLGWRVPSFSVAMLAACCAALVLTARRARREGLSTDAVHELAVWLMTGGFIGARALYLISHPDSIRGIGDVLQFGQGGIVYYGCIIGGLIGSVLYWMRRPFPFRAMADAVAPALALGLAIGRLGCYFNGCCYGAPCAWPWSVAFPAGTLPWARHVEAGLVPASASASLAIHPTQLYGALNGLIILGLLTAYYPRRRRDGEVMALLMVTYGVTRFLVEGLRADEPRIVLGLTLSQAISVFLLAAGLVAWWGLFRAPLGRYADSARTDAGGVPEPHLGNGSRHARPPHGPIRR